MEEAVLFFLLELLLRLLEEPWLVVGREEDVVPLRLPPLQAAIDSAMAQARKRTETRLVRVFIGHIHLSVLGRRLCGRPLRPALLPAVLCIESGFAFDGFSIAPKPEWFLKEI